MTSQMQPQSETERQLAPIVNRIIAEGGTGYRWADADQVLSSFSPHIVAPRVKKASGSGRAANVLIESRDRSAFDLYFIVVTEDYSAQEMKKKAHQLMQASADIQAVAIAEASQPLDDWHVQHLLLRPETPEQKDLEQAFPSADVAVVTPPHSSEESATYAPEALSAPRSEVPRAQLDANGLSHIVYEFRKHADAAGITFNCTLVADLIAATLSTQFLIFAGPSGSGKSTAARALKHFFAPPDSWAVIEGRRQLIGPEELVGYRSGITEQYSKTPDLTELLRISGPGGEDTATPILLIEEANLSPMEGYLNPLIHGLGGTRTDSIDWTLQSDDENADPAIPSALSFYPYPRLFATLNVDATAPAPSPKVTSRACVILLEPEAGVSTNHLIGAVQAALKDRAPIEPHGAPYLMDPVEPVRTAGASIADILTALTIFMTDTGVSSHASLTHRQAQQCVQFMAWYELLVRGLLQEQNDRLRLAAEQAFLHFILPQTEAVQFTTILDTLYQHSGLLSDPPAYPDELGGLLISRVERLSQGTALIDPLSGAMDFWERLS